MVIAVSGLAVGKSRVMLSVDYEEQRNKVLMGAILRDVVTITWREEKQIAGTGIVGYHGKGALVRCNEIQCSRSVVVCCLRPSNNGCVRSCGRGYRWYGYW